jgi:hypothetical protein
VTFITNVKLKRHLLKFDHGELSIGHFLTWDVRYSVAFLMDSEVAEITEEDDVRVRTFAVHTDAADCIVVDGRAVVFAVCLDVKVGLFLQPTEIHFPFINLKL